MYREWLEWTVAACHGMPASIDRLLMMGRVEVRHGHYSHSILYAHISMILACDLPKHVSHWRCQIF